MANEVPGECPVCGENLNIARLYCTHCDTSIEGKFDLCKFCRLSKEQRAFIDVFIKCRGNIKEVEKELGVSYPTVRNKLDNVLEALGYSSGLRVDDNAAEEKKAVLAMLQNGEIDYDQALQMLKNKRGCFK